MILVSRTRNSSRDGLPGSMPTSRSGTSLPRPGRSRIRAPAAVTRPLTSAAAMTSAASVGGKTTARTITTAKLSVAALTAGRTWTPPVQPTRRAAGNAACTGLRPPLSREIQCRLAAIWSAINVEDLLTSTTLNSRSIAGVSRIKRSLTRESSHVIRRLIRDAYPTARVRHVV
jgi:hypothetical protein